MQVQSIKTIHMKTNNLRRELDKYIPLLTAREQTILLEMAKGLLQVEPKAKRISVDKYNEELEASIKEAREGKVISHEDLLKDMKKW